MGIFGSKDAAQGECCPSNSLGFKPEDPNYMLKGKMIKIGEVDAYSVGEGSRCVIVVHDVFGMYSGMNKQVCDTLADGIKDTRFVLPDFFQGEYLNGKDPQADLKGPWLLFNMLWGFISGQLFSFIKAKPWSKVGPIFDATTDQMSQEGCKSFGLIGICWGAYITFKALTLAKDKEKIKFAASFHPSVKSVADLFGENDLDLVKGVACPQYILSTTMEPESWHPNGEVHKALQAIEGIGPKCEVHSTSQQHGFMTRGDTSNPETFKEIALRLEQFAAFAKANFPE